MPYLLQHDDDLGIIDPSSPINWDDELNRGLISRWLALPDQQRGVFWRDLCKRNHGTLTSMTPAAWGGARGRPGGWGSLSFDGTDDYVDAGSPSSLNLSSSPVTYSAWVKTNAVNSVHHYIAGDYNSNGVMNSGAILLRSTNVFNLVWGDVSIVSGTTTPNTGQWYHVVGVREGSSGNWTGRIYVNGVQEASASTATNPHAQQSFSIGRPGAYNGFYWNGLIDDACIYNRALSASDVRELYEDQMQFSPRTIRRLRTARWFMAESIVGELRHRTLMGVGI